MLARNLFIGDMVNLEEDHVFDRACEDQFCVHRTQNVELVESEGIPGDGQYRMTFVNGNGEHFVGDVHSLHVFRDAE